MASRCLVCAVPRRRPVESLRRLLPGYNFFTASSVTALRTLARREACDLYIVQTPLGWDDAAAVCAHIRAYDQHTPIVVYAREPSERERREVIAAGAQAYATPSDDPHNLHGRVGQLIMLAELRSMDAMTEKSGAMQDHLAGRLARITRRTQSGHGAVPREVQARLKSQAARLFTQAGGTPANFERMWPSIYERAVNAIPKPRQ